MGWNYPTYVPYAPAPTAAHIEQTPPTPLPDGSTVVKVPLTYGGSQVCDPEAATALLTSICNDLSSPAAAITGTVTEDTLDGDQTYVYPDPTDPRRVLRINLSSGESDWAGMLLVGQNRAGIGHPGHWISTNPDGAGGPVLYFQLDPDPTPTWTNS